MSQAGPLITTGSGPLPPDVPTSFSTNFSPAVPSGNDLEIYGAFVIAGTDPVFTTGAGNVVTVNVQLSQASGSSNANLGGLASFNSADFVVDANGYVTLSGAGSAIIFNADVGSATPIANTINFIGTSVQGISSSASGNTVVYTIANATSTQKGVSSFNATEFTVTAGNVTSNNFSVIAGAGLSGGGSLTLGGSVTLSAGGTIATTYTANTGTATPSGNNLNILGASVAAGSTPVATTASGSTVTVDVQTSQAIVSTDATKIGLAAFNSAEFTVDANGFVGLVGGGNAIEKVNLQSGTTPIVPTAGAITFNGATVAAGTHPVRTDGTGANTMALEVQISQAIASTDATKIGLSNYSSAQFAVDANGFVTLVGGTTAPILGLVPDAHTAPGTTPVIPNGSGNIIVTGSSTAAGTIPVQTNSLAANTIAIQVQKSQAIASTDATKVGLAAFNSSEFTVDANGFVGLVGGGAGIESVNVQTGTSPIVPSSGAITINGATVAAGTHPVRTDGTGPNTLAVEVQVSQALAATDITKIGLSNFNSTEFSVDANGFVTSNNFTINAGTGLSGGGALTLGGSVTLSINGGVVGETITGNTGGALSPTAGNWNILGPNSALTGYSPWTTGSGSTLTVNIPGTVKWVVNSTANLGTHTTVQAAITTASSGDDVFITPGTYTENVTLKAGVNLVAYPADATSGQVKIIGNLTLSTAGIVNISGIELQTNSANCLTVSGSNASIVNLVGCNINCTNNTGISFTASNTSAAINGYECWGNLGTTGIGIANSSSTGTIIFYSCNFTNTGASTTVTTNSAGLMTFQNSAIQSPVSSTGTGSISGANTSFNSNFGGIACTVNGTGASEFYHCRFASSNNSAISIGTGATGQFYICDISTLSVAIVGAGTIAYGGLVFESGGNSTITTTTQSPQPFTVQQGGTFKSSFDAYSLVCAGTTTTGQFQDVPSVASGQVLTSAGTAALPVWSTTPSVTSITLNGGTALGNYVEGTYSPTLDGAVSGTTTYTSQVGSYVRIGNFLYLQGRVAFSAATGTGNAQLGAFPFTSRNVSNQTNEGTVAISAAGWSWPVSRTSLSLQILANATIGTISVNGTAIALAQMQMTNSAGTILYTATYEI